MEAVAVSAINADVFLDVLKNGAKRIIDTGCVIVPEGYLKIVDEYTDWKLEKEAARRLDNDNGERVSQDEAMLRLGMTVEDLKGWEEVEIE